jgi:hypothetical protein
MYEDIIADAITRPLPRSVRRDIELPHKDGFATVAVGVRRSGKTRLLQQKMDDLLQEGVPRSHLLFIDFEDDRLYPLRPTILSDMLETYYRMVPEARAAGAYVFFDEIQAVPNWGRFCRRLLDTENVELYVSGSSARMLSSELATEFRGRSRVVHVTPLSFRECTRFAGCEPGQAFVGAMERSRLEALFLTYLEVGGFPGIQGDEAAERIATLQDYFEAIVTRDVVERHAYPNYQAVRYFAREALRCSGLEFSVNKTYNAMKSLGLGMAKDRLYALRGDLEDAYAIANLQIFIPSPARRSQHATKVYACDQGLSLAVSHARSNDVGHRLETAVYNELVRRRYGTCEVDVSYYAERGVAEVDFVVGDVLDGEAVQAIQVATDLEDAATLNRELRGADFAMERFGLGEAQLITLTDEGVYPTPHGTVRAVPAWKWFLGLEGA